MVNCNEALNLLLVRQRATGPRIVTAVIVIRAARTAVKKNHIIFIRIRSISDPRDSIKEPGRRVHQ